MKPELYAYVDESFVAHAGLPKRILVGAVVVSSPRRLEAAVERARLDALADESLWEVRGGNKPSYKRRERFSASGFHFTEDSRALRVHGFRAMLSTDVRMHVVYSEKRAPDVSDRQAHFAMLFTIVHTVLRRYAGMRVNFIFENADDEVQNYFGAVVERATAYLDSLNSGAGVPRAQAAAAIGHKPLPGLAVADYALGVVNLDLDPALMLLDDDRMLLRLAGPHLAHLMNFDDVKHRRKFDRVEVSSWTEHIQGVISHPVSRKTISTLIGPSPAGVFAHLPSERELALRLGYSRRALKSLVERSDDPASYSAFNIEVRGKKRLVREVVDVELAMGLKRIASLLAPTVYMLHPACAAYVPGRSAMDAATPHLGAPLAQRLDIRDFFGSTRLSTVSSALQRFGATPPVADILSRLLTFEDELPAGASTSPLIANLVLADFDYEMDAWARRNDLAYSRYADDLVFSGENDFDATTTVKDALAKLGYQLNPRKTRKRLKGQYFRVAGLTIDTDRPRVPKRRKYRLRNEAHWLQGRLAGICEAGLTIKEALGDLDGPEHARYRAAQGLARYCVGVEWEWTMRQLAKFPLAEAAFLPAKRKSEGAAGGLPWLADLDAMPKLSDVPVLVGKVPEVRELN